MAAKSAPRPLGVILHRGRSIFDGSPYVVIMPLGKSSNEKTGSMLQTYIIRSEVHPAVAVRNGGDTAICNDCPMRGLAVKQADYAGKGKLKWRSCYVNVGQGPGSIYRAYKRGRYVDYMPTEHDRFIAGRKIRFGSYGEPVLIPLPLMRHLAGISAGWTGYTHQWSNPALRGYRDFLMASVHGTSGAWSSEHARSLGWRYFRTMHDGAPQDHEILCPASKEAGYRLSCNQCNLCDGAGRRAKGLDVVNIYIPGHGGKAVMGAVRNLPILQG